MTVKELIEKLKAVPGELDVLLSSDGEGNGFGELDDVDLSDRDCEGEPCHPDDADDTKGQCIVLWPEG